MGESRGVRAWHILMGISLLLYLANASFLVYLQSLYYGNAGIINSITSVLPQTYVSQINKYLQLGFMGITGVISIILTLVMLYIIVNALQSRGPGAGRTMKIALVILLIIQFFMGNVGFVLGLIIGLIGSLLMR
ncbi:hypothetical protein [Vulcanisaeta souniana]|uniref:Uncharacterized protein n=1 Tax=Vulcanisaeta souniana JCM 11219 TaxID=1293586 RepID=A0A830DZZ9_9CREN|nr:hypothetical protein [Vulcanisaeta souniana]BDR91949.1 hypothetical protein Vsou_10420 [Vulcanisaeta souniana JCM 11219]GGI69115.1 hypothetical protein GCM10007112_02620 [Vulcanisaeta souniana JCM 11219]